MTEAKPTKKQVPLRPGRFKIPEEPGRKPYLLASRCRSCGKHFFPTRVICLNCGKQELEDVPLRGRGKLYTYTIAMDEGCQVQTVVTEGWDSLKIGMNMEVYFEKIREDTEGNEQIVYKFRAVKK